MPQKPKKNQPETPSEIQDRDVFLTPFYATDLIVPFIPKSVKKIWECASGELKLISKRLEHWGYKVYSTDLLFGQNFLEYEPEFEFDCIITNTPFSIKSKFYQRCIQHGKPFGLLLPADYSKWICNSISEDGSEKVVPDSRINYITPNVTDIVWKSDIKKKIELEHNKKYKKYKDIPQSLIDEWSPLVHKYKTIMEIPNEKIAKNSSSQFHSMWLTNGFAIGSPETIVELNNKEKTNIK